MVEATAFPRRHSEQEAAALIGVSVSTLRRLERAGEIWSFRPTPRKIYYLDPDLLAFMHKRTGTWSRNGNIPVKSATSGHPSDRTHPSGAALDTIPLVDRRDAHLLAQRTFGKRRSS
jgi:hypothetical protein